MRLIDADDLMEELKSLRVTVSSGVSVDTFKESVLKIVEEQATQKAVVMGNLFQEVGKLQKNYHTLKYSGKITKKAICELVIPFKEKYELSGLQALMIARNEMSIYEISTLFETLKKE